jgi:MFS transporter, DHA1 family, tetracycline resistance protein
MACSGGSGCGHYNIEQGFPFTAQNLYNKRMRRSPLVFIFITVFVDMLGYGMVVPLLPFFVQRQAGGAALVGSLGSLYAMMQLLSGPVLGALSDRFGRRPVLLVCLAGSGLAFCLLGLANSLELIFAAVLLDGLTGGNLTTANAYIADITAPEERSSGIGLVGAAFGLGIIAGPAIGGLLSAYGLAIPAFSAAGVALANVVFGWFVLPESLPVAQRSSEISWKALNPLTQLSRLPGLGASRLLLAAVFILNLAFVGLQNNFPLFSQSRFGWDGVRNGVFFAFVGICSVFVQGIFYRWVQPRIGERRLSLIGLGLMSAGLASVALARVAWMVYPAIALVALGTGVSIPSLSGIISNQVAQNSQGRLMGGMQVLLSLTAILGPGIAGVMFQQIGDGAPYVSGAALALAAFVIALAAFRHSSSPSREKSAFTYPEEG